MPNGICAANGFVSGWLCAKITHYVAKPRAQFVRLGVWSRSGVNFPSPSASIQIGFVAPSTRGFHFGEEAWYGRGMAQ